MTNFVEFFNWLSSANFQYSLEYDYDRSDCTGRCSDYCRCTTIENFRVRGSSFNACNDIFMDFAKLNPQLTLEQLYCFHKTIHLTVDSRSDNWEPDISSGYYGQELFKVTLNEKIAQKLLSRMMKLEELPLVDAMEWLLTQEYDFILPRLKNKSWTIKTFSLEQVRKFNVPQMHDVDYEKTQKIKFQDKALFKLPQGILHEGVLIDGRHRWSTITSFEDSSILMTSKRLNERELGKILESIPYFIVE